MAQLTTLEGTWAELEPVLKQRPTQRFRLLPLPTEETATNADDQTLADWLGDLVGAVETETETDASQIHTVLTKRLAEKQFEGRL